MVHELVRNQRFFADTLEEAENLVEIAKENPEGELLNIGIQKKSKKVKLEEEVQIVEYYLVSFSYEVTKLADII